MVDPSKPTSCFFADSLQPAKTKTASSQTTNRFVGLIDR
jgi:hypothetical protein